MNKQKSADAHTTIQLTVEERVANTIVNRLIIQGLLPESLAEEIFYALSEGHLRESDWRLLAEKALANKNGGANES